MTLVIENTFTGKKEVFEPIKGKEVLFYVCGVTVYDMCHIGHARAYIAFDVMRRYLEYLGYDVKFIQNFTDIDDKILQRAKEKGISFKELSQENIKLYFEDMDGLNIKRATHYPLATDYIKEMQDIICSLIKKGKAYVIEGDVYFAVEEFTNYGKLSKKSLDDLIAGSRVDISEKKHNPLDFVLWKKAKDGEPSWTSPWGPGRPGWHIECTAMSINKLGRAIDIHAGGEDLIFPHHENEIAQSESFTGEKFVKYWIHNGFVNIKQEKMSKSKHNFVTIRDILKEFSGDTVRLFLLRAHYRAPFSFSWEGLKDAQHALDRLLNTLNKCPLKGLGAAPGKLDSETEGFEAKFKQAMDNDFNYAKAIGVLFELNKFIHKNGIGANLLLRLGQILGLFEGFTKKDQELSSDLLDLIEERTQAKKNKDFAAADAIRAKLLNEHNLVLEDTAEGVRWKINK